MRALLSYFGPRGVLTLCFLLAISACGRNPAPDLGSALSQSKIVSQIVPQGGGDGIGIELLPMVGCSASDGTRVTLEKDSKDNFSATLSSQGQTRTVTVVIASSSTLLFEGLHFQLRIDSSRTQGHLTATLKKSQIDTDVTCRLTSL